MEFNVTAEFPMLVPSGDEGPEAFAVVDQVIDGLADVGVVVTATVDGTMAVVVTVEAESPTDAVRVALDRMSSVVDAAAIAFEVLPTTAYDDRDGCMHGPVRRVW